MSASWKQKSMLACWEAFEPYFNLRNCCVGRKLREESSHASSSGASEASPRLRRKNSIKEKGLPASYGVQGVVRS